MSLPRSPRPIVVVPGGGALADEVRAAQTSSASATAPRIAWRSLPWISSPGPSPACARLRGRRHRGGLAPNSTPGPRCGVGALQPRRRPQRHSAVLDRDLGQSRAVARAPPRRRMLLCHQIHRAGRAEFSAEQLARDGVVDAAFPAMLRELASPSSCSAAAIRRPSPRASQLRRRLRRNHRLASMR